MDENKKENLVGKDTLGEVTGTLVSMRVNDDVQDILPSTEVKDILPKVE